MTSICPWFPVAKISNSLAAGVIYVIAIGFAIYFLWDTHKINRTLKNEYKREKGD